MLRLPKSWNKRESARKMMERHQIESDANATVSVCRIGLRNDSTPVNRSPLAPSARADHTLLCWNTGSVSHRMV